MALRNSQNNFLRVNVCEIEQQGTPPLEIHHQTPPIFSQSKFLMKFLVLGHNEMLHLTVIDLQKRLSVNEIRSDGHSAIKSMLTLTLSAWPLRNHTAKKSILWESVFLDQLHDFSLLSLNSYLQLFFKAKFMKNSYTPKKFHFQSQI